MALDTSMNFTQELNKMVQDVFSQSTPWIQNSSTFPQKYSYIFSQLVQTKAPDLIKIAELNNYLSFWNRPISFGGWVRNIGIGIAKPMDSASLADGTAPNAFTIKKPDVSATYHDTRVRLQYGVTLFENQLKEAFGEIQEFGAFLASVLGSINNGVNDSLYKEYKQVFYRYYTSELTAAQRTALTVSLPATVNTTALAQTAIDQIRNAMTDMYYGRSQYNAMNFYHAASPQTLILYITTELANALVDYIRLDHFDMAAMQGVSLADIPTALSTFLGIKVVLLDDLGGLIPYDSSNAQLYPIYDSQGATTGTYAATPGGTTAVTVDHWAVDSNYPVRAVLAEADFGNIFTSVDQLGTIYNPLAGGYTNMFRFIDQLVVAKPSANTIYFS